MTIHETKKDFRGSFVDTKSTPLHEIHENLIRRFSWVFRGWSGQFKATKPLKGFVGVSWMWSLA
jgi:hypothetical protein